MRMYFIHCHDKVWGYESDLRFFTQEPYRKSRWVSRGDAEMYLYGSYHEAEMHTRRINPRGLPCFSIGCVEVDL